MIGCVGLTNHQNGQFGDWLPRSNNLTIRHNMRRSNVQNQPSWQAPYVVSCCCQVTLSGVDPSRVVVGNVMCKAGGVLPAVRRFNAQIVALPALEVRDGKGPEQIPICERAHALGKVAILWRLVRFCFGHSGGCLARVSVVGLRRRWCFTRGCRTMHAMARHNKRDLPAIPWICNYYNVYRLAWVN